MAKCQCEECRKVKDADKVRLVIVGTGPLAHEKHICTRCLKKSGKEAVSPEQARQATVSVFTGNRSNL